MAAAESQLGRTHSKLILSKASAPHHGPDTVSDNPGRPRGRSFQRAYERSLERLLPTNLSTPEATAKPRRPTVHNDPEPELIKDMRAQRDLALRRKKEMSDLINDAQRKIVALEEQVAHLQIEQQPLPTTEMPPQPDYYREAPVSRESPGYMDETRYTPVTDTVSNWRPRGSHPNSHFKGEDVDEYGPWRYAIDAKLEDDYPLYPTKRSKIRYTLSRIDKPIFDIMQTFVLSDPTKTFADLMCKAAILI
ncbi:hypothetical protein ASPVEDRAFT_88968 [Aspergillus versicolor CBS 583.65]|uniref:Uncharacterized protein n=1 Tax=Aspergillus versicolor CBS 583.65 TaxID=1036611 RepID=A0A1L9Q1W0_ASPVE|nr:uncharacterized protein ASPVEDRAFT_88968 [Aspergillus versicolor CBS 583.65]OJJ07728.1 hypothetical protein ASPVEDRAFT_88968 [Aspergillus versicolor CBS 583.65]